MNDQLDTELARVRDSLHAEARDGAHSAAALADVKAGLVPMAPEPSRRPTWWVTAAVVAAAAATIVGVVVLTRDDRAATTVPATVPATEPSLPPAPIETTVPATNTAPTTAPPTTFAPHTQVPVTRVESVASISYGTATDGWAVASIDGSNELIRTVPSGWVLADSPVRGDSLYSVRFADALNGWIIGTNRWWSTHDGGGSWNELPLTLTGGSAPDVAIAGRWVLTSRIEEVPAQGYAVRVWRSPVGEDDFQPTDAVWPKGAGGNDVTLAAAFDGTDVLVAENDRGGTTLRLHPDGTVSPWSTPAAGRGGDIVLSSPPAGGPVWVQSRTGSWGGDTVAKQVLAVSPAAGQPFVDVAPPEPIDLTNVGALLCALSPLDAATAVAVMCDAKGARQYRTSDLGATWEQVAEVTSQNDTEWSWNSSVSPSGVITLFVNLTTSGTSTSEVWMIPDSTTSWIKVL